MTCPEVTTCRLAAGMIELGTQALTDSPDDGCIRDSALELIENARYMVRDMLGFMDGNDTRLNPKAAPSKEAL